jgi:hypothetical protein
LAFLTLRMEAIYFSETLGFVGGTRHYSHRRENINSNLSVDENLDSSVGIATDYGLGRSSSPANVKNFLFSTLLRVVRHENMVMSLAGLGLENGYAVEGQQKFTRTEPEGKRSLGTPRRRWEDNTITSLWLRDNKTGSELDDLIY